jgi:predicted nucleic acid-binding protein
MIVVSDTSPLNYVVLLDIAHILPSLFGEVVIPTAVLAELSRPETPTKVRDWANNRPDWLRVEAPSAILSGLDLDPGETEAISIAVARKADALLIDDRKGRRVAGLQGITTISTLTVLEAAAKDNLISLPEVVEQLASTNFRVKRSLLDEALARDAARRGQPGPG